MNKNLQIKNSWEEISISDYIKLIEINENEDLTAIEKNVKIISICSELDENFIFNLTQSELSQIFSRLSMLNSIPETDDVKFEFEYDDIKIIFNDNIGDMTTRQWMDIVELNKNQTTPLQNIHLILASLATVEYDENIHIKLDVPELIRNKFSIIDAIALSNFFFAQYAILTQASLEMEKMKVMKMNPTTEKLLQQKDLLLTNLEYSQLLMQYQMLQN